MSLAQIFIVVLAIGAFILVTIIWRFLGLWISALASGVNVPLVSLIGMQLRRVTPSRIIFPLIKARKAGLSVIQNNLEAHFLAGGNIDKVVDALIAADKAGIPLTFEQATAIDLAGRDVLEAVRVSVNPKVITTPIVQGMAQDGIQLLASARITVRVKIDRLVGGAGEETIIARVGEGIVAAIGAAIDHKQVLEQPDIISKTSRLTLPRWMSVRTSALNCAPIRPRPTNASHRPRPKNVVPWPSPSNKKCRLEFRRCGPKSSRPKPRCQWRSPRHSVPANWA
jgi:uncharacterized protein YqfA (UPF0365 family)